MLLPGSSPLSRQHMLLQQQTGSKLGGRSACIAMEMLKLSFRGIQTAAVFSFGASTDVRDITGSHAEPELGGGLLSAAFWRTFTKQITLTAQDTRRLHVHAAGCTSVHVVADL